VDCGDYVYELEVVKPEGERKHWRLWPRWEDNIKMNHKEIEREDVD